MSALVEVIHMKANVLGMNNGLMVYWEEVKEAAQYYVHLLIGDKNKRTEYQNGCSVIVEDAEKKQEIALISVERNIKYYSFVDLARIDVRSVYRYDRGRYQEETGRNYYVFVEAENREGKIIDKCEPMCCKVKEMMDGSAL